MLEVIGLELMFLAMYFSPALFVWQKITIWKIGDVLLQPAERFKPAPCNQGTEFDTGALIHQFVIS